MLFLLSVLVMSGGLTRDPERPVKAFFTASNTSENSCFLPDLPEDRNFNTLNFINNQLILCGGDGRVVFHISIEYIATLGPSWNFSSAENLARFSLQDGLRSGNIIGQNHHIAPAANPHGLKFHFLSNH